MNNANQNYNCPRCGGLLQDRSQGQPPQLCPNLDGTSGDATVKKFHCQNCAQDFTLWEIPKAVKQGESIVLSIRQVWSP